MSPVAGLALTGWGALALLALFYWLERSKVKALKSEAKANLSRMLALEHEAQTYKELHYEESLRSQHIQRVMRTSAKACTKDLEEIARLGKDDPAIRKRMLERFARIVRETEGDPQNGSG